MKTIYEHTIGGDGAVVGLYVDKEKGVVVVQETYPLAKALDPANQFIDKTIDSIEAKIPGDWDKAIFEPARTGAKALIAKVVAE